MGFLSNSASVVRMQARVPGTLDRVHFATKVSEHAFRDPEDDANAPVARSGWVAVHGPLVTDLTPSDLFFQQYLAVGFRHDRRAVPAQLLRIERRRLENERRTGREGGRLGAAERREIKLEVESRLLTRALPVPRLVDCVWNLETGRLFLSGGSRLLREAFTSCFRATFGITPVPMIPYVAAEHVGLSPHALEQLRAAEPATLIERPPDGVPSLPIGLKELRP
jgi:DNA recombination-dependent growth factor C